MLNSLPKLNKPIKINSNPLILDVCSWTVIAGFPSPAADYTQQRIDLNNHLIRNKDATYLFRVKGDSMINVGIYENDILLVDRSVTPKHDHIILAQLNNEFTVKRLYRRGGVVKLLAENNIYPPRLIKEEDDLIAWGVVTYNLHKLC
tara:strand:+ start:799 stop:1239 length:441 start_codon:yes stop_codon:yes gene_type:complete